MPASRAMSPARSRASPQSQPTRAKSPGRSRPSARSAPRGRAEMAAHKRRKGAAKGNDGSEEDEEEGEEEMPEKLTRKIIAQAREQQEEINAETSSGAAGRARPNQSFGASMADDDNEDLNDDVDGDDDDDDDFCADDAYDAGVEELDLSEQDQRALELFMGGGAPRTLADIIMQKIAEKEAGGEEEPAEAMPMPALPPKVIEVYKGVGKLLHTYRSGKLPKVPPKGA
eukprot:3677832-Pleurochrysis_carterae.AAC.1